jgi:hypothetical protein
MRGVVVSKSGTRLYHPARDRTTIRPVGFGADTDSGGEVVAVPIVSLRPGESPRLNGEDKTHIASLAEAGAPLPPILVDRHTMRVIDGMHRMMAASLQGRETIDVVFFDGSEADVFLRAVQANVTHGLPLSHADRRAAAERIIATHPHMSDRAIGRSAGLGSNTVAAIRKHSTEESRQSNVRVGRDGRARPLNTSEARRRAAEILVDRPEATLRDVARAAGISPATVLDVRKRLQRGESPVPGKLTASPPSLNSTAVQADPAPSTRPALPPNTKPVPAASPAATVEKLMRDPSLRNNERGKGILRLLHVNAIGAEQLPDMAAAIPAHCVATVAQLAREYVKMWQDFATELDARAHLLCRDPIRPPVRPVPRPHREP